MDVRESLKMIGEPKPGKTILSFPSVFHSAPRSAKAALRAMNPPQMAGWRVTRETKRGNEDWTSECQGLTTDGRHWYVCSNNSDLRAIHKFTLDFKQHLGKVKLPSGVGHHIGDIDHHDGRIYVPVHSDHTPLVWVLDQNLKTLGISRLAGNATIEHFGWCAVNPWNGWLYTSTSTTDRVHAYAPTDGFAYKGFLRLGGPSVFGLQGGCFSTNGHLYLTSDRYIEPKATKDIRAYSALNGAFLGSCPVQYDESRGIGGNREEMEGLAIAHLVHEGGDLTHVHVVILDNDVVNPDDVIIKHFAVPDPALL